MRKGKKKKREKRKGEKEQEMNIHPVAPASTLNLNPQRNSPIEAHQDPASCLLSSSEPQAPGGSGLEDIDSNDDDR